MKNFKKIIAAILILDVVLTIGISIGIKDKRAKRAAEVAGWWFNKYSVVAHGMGGIDGYDYTNSLEAFKYNYSKGTRVFEVDLALTSDNQLVLTHGWLDHKINRLGYEGADRKPMSHDEFMSLPINDTYTPLDLEDLIGIMSDYPDIYVVIDWGKDLDYVPEDDHDYIFDIDDLIERNKIMINEFKKTDESLLKRVIPQIYYEDHFYKLDKIYPFENYIYTLYKNFENTTAKQVMEFCTKNDIAVVVSNFYGDQANITKEVKRQINLDRTLAKEMGIFIHTINSIEDTTQYIGHKYKGIFTDFLTQEEIDSIDFENTEISDELF